MQASSATENLAPALQTIAVEGVEVVSATEAVEGDSGGNNNETGGVPAGTADRPALTG